MPDEPETPCGSGKQEHAHKTQKMKENAMQTQTHPEGDISLGEI